VLDLLSGGVGNGAARRKGSACKTSKGIAKEKSKSEFRDHRDVMTCEIREELMRRWIIMYVT
jgi:hypothetical protein